MRYTPNLNLPVAEGTDTKDTYADSVEGPSKDTIDALLGPAAIPAHGRGNVTSWTPATGVWEIAPLTNWTYISGGAVVDGYGLSVPPGLYLAVCRLYITSGGSNTSWAVRLGDLSTHKQDIGGGVYPAATGWGNVTGVRSVLARETIALWVTRNYAGSVNYPELVLTRIGEPVEP